MKIKTVLFVMVFLVLIWSTNLIGQPLPGDPVLSGNDSKPVGGGADLIQNLSILIIPSVIYMVYKLRDHIWGVITGQGAQ